MDFTRDINDIPDRIKDSVSELQEAIKDGDINTVYFWYVHNMNEKNNPEVQEELNTVQIAAQKLVNNLAGDNSVKIVSLEVGMIRLNVGIIALVNELQLKKRLM